MSRRDKAPRHPPRKYWLLALVLAGLAWMRPLETTWLPYSGFLELSDPLVKEFQLGNRLVLGVGIVACVLAARARFAALWFTPLLGLILGWNTWIAAKLDLLPSVLTGVSGTLIVFMVEGELVALWNRRGAQIKQWKRWLSPARKRLSLQTLLWPSGGGELVCRTYDVSDGGAFIPLDDAIWAPTRGAPLSTLTEGSRCTVRLGLDSERVLHCEAEVIRQTKARGRYPSGIAIRFLNLEGEEKELLGSFLGTRVA